MNAAYDQSSHFRLAEENKYITKVIHKYKYSSGKKNLLFFGI